MNKTKHTPAPWKQGSPDATDEYFYSINAEYASFPICRVNLQSQEGKAEANARLIAAAPELLEALEELMLIVSIHSKSTTNDFAWAEMELAQAAIAKARGEV